MSDRVARVPRSWRIIADDWFCFWTVVQHAVRVRSVALATIHTI